jgi:DMSO/TMAO reductase YedYZ molybdopterin-dependent catalytic subunit
LRLFSPSFAFPEGNNSGDMTDDSHQPDKPSLPRGHAGEVRFTRKWFLLVVGAVIAAVVGITELLRRSGTSLKGVVTAPNSLLGAFPVRSAESVPQVAASDWTITVDGLVDHPLTVSHADWRALARVAETVDFHCVEGWSVGDVKWGGVAPATLVEQAGAKPEATHVVFHAEGGTYTDSLPLDLVRDSQTLLADTLNDEPLPAEHGGPIRLVVPKQLGYKSVKWVVRLELTDKPPKGYWEQRGYPVDAPV